MTAHDPNLAPRGLWYWLGFGANRHDVEFESEDAAPAQVVLAPSPQDRLRRSALDDVCRFIQAHRLPVSGFTLTVAHEIATGANPDLARLVAGRIARREPVTLTWLEDALEAEGMGSADGQIEALVQRLESAIVELGSTASAARTATSDYHTALEAHVVDLSMLSNASSVILELTSLTREMLSRTREIERELNRSERETQSLQKSLADAPTRAARPRSTTSPACRTAAPSKAPCAASTPRPARQARRCASPFATSITSSTSTTCMGTMPATASCARSPRRWRLFPATSATSPATGARNS